MIHIFDADSLWHLMNMKNIENIDFINSKFIFTPNKVEFKRFYEKFFENENNKENNYSEDLDYDNEQYKFFMNLFENEKDLKYNTSN